MSPALQDQLYALHPQVLRDKPCINCGDGWYTLIDRLCLALLPSWAFSFSLEADGVKTLAGYDYWSPEPPLVTLENLKEKMGTLRVSDRLDFAATNPTWEADSALYPKAVRQAFTDYGRFVHGIIHAADVVSGVTCEETGQPGQLCAKGGWLKTLCPEQAAKQGYVLWKAEATRF